MKVLSRDFSFREKALMVFLSLLLVGLAYYRFVDMPVRESIEKSTVEIENLETELQQVQAKVMRLRNLKSKLDMMEELGELSYMPSYNGSKAEVAFLNDVLAATESYNISFADVTRSGSQIRRSFTLQYTTKEYSEAEAVMKELCGYRNRCLVRDVRCVIEENGKVSVSASATFFETMVGGTPDAGLPEDSAVVNS